MTRTRGELGAASPAGAARPVLYVEHVPWEGPHRIAAAIDAAVPVQTVRPLEGEPLPDAAAVAGVVSMGGPMGVGDTHRHPQLADEIAWLERALGLDLPLLGICLGAQLLARALGAPVTRAAAPEIGWAPVTVERPDDRLLGGLAPETTALHWHGDAFETPAGATRLASSEQTECQAFRHGAAWGVLFHPEADRALVEAWLDEPTMMAGAQAVLGASGAAALTADAEVHERALVAASTPGFEAFAQLVRNRSHG